MEIVPWKYKNPYSNEKYKEKRSILIGTYQINIQQIPTKSISLDQNTGAVVWDGSYLLANYIADHINVYGKSVMELGAGTGLSGITAKLYGASTVYLTDIEDQCQLLQMNIEANATLFQQHSIKSDSLIVKELIWGTEKQVEIPTVDIILGSEILYLKQFHQDLITTIRTYSDKNTVLYFVYKQRGLGEEEFFDLAEEYFEVDMISKDQFQPEFQQSEYVMFSMRFK
ncbi:putative methyltransferase-domain-containing protein [Globomyces pollinis-pini]|nr:putative methyltransferase-domain-containing protein [Globomyces pollinis-pini]